MDQRNLAMGLASLGRGPDAALVHMSPSEVQALQRLAEQHGGSLTINPETGLPEAGFLSQLLPTLIGVGLAGFTGGTSLAALGMSAPMAAFFSNPLTLGLLSGGIAGLITGDIGQAAKWGLGVGGGAALGQGFMGAGASSGQMTPTVASSAAGKAATEAGTTAFNTTFAQLTAKNAGVQAATAGGEAARRAAIDSVLANYGVGGKAGLFSGFQRMGRGATNVFQPAGVAPIPGVAVTGTPGVTAPIIQTGGLDTAAAGGLGGGQGHGGAGQYTPMLYRQNFFAIGVGV